ncbi:MAG: hypothetical protein UV73_C0007G0067 [Candidatus Gottesmanbacteria bacterium GW2011_GWA2_43_14]|uniref:Uncharacterized protein n=1 Tax=Candidatus Gottesmanbacteria bacterium GW2011_GWA2_43_14 TaxID=1618443 RepID=A0A0G1DIY3_9BACT|nr:MAG: hypothetical protein UV73_C0007G0067 [Candidatus Gottesmanbacteria bacterium GW2011_GWA2_43_14]
MLSHIRIALPPQVHLTVEEGDQISENTVIYKTGEEALVSEIPVAQLLKVKPDLTVKYLRRRPGEAVVKGDILAEKKGILATLSVRSPHDGVIRELDLKKGHIILAGKEDTQKTKVSLPINGKIKKISRAYLEIEVKGEVLEGRKGAGNDRFAQLMLIPDDRFNITDFDADVEDKIVYIKKAPREVVLKLDVLGAKGLISAEMAEAGDFSAVEVDIAEAGKLHKAANKWIWLKPSEKLILIID